MSMSIRTLTTFAMAVALVGPTEAQQPGRYNVVDESTLTRTLSFAAGGGRTLDVRNINGFIHVEGTSDSAVQMSVHKVVRAETKDDLAEAQRDVRLDFREGTQSVEATVSDRRSHICGEQWNDNGERWDPVHYESALISRFESRAMRRCACVRSMAATSSSTARRAISTSATLTG